MEFCTFEFKLAAKIFFSFPRSSVVYVGMGYTDIRMAFWGLLNPGCGVGWIWGNVRREGGGVLIFFCERRVEV